jgi:YVTN family beta-propeller protein
MPVRAAAALFVACVASIAASCARESTRPGGGVRIFVTNEVSGDLSVVDPASQRVIGTVPLGKRPRGIKVSPDKHSLYIALSGSPIAGPGVDRDALPPADRAADGIGEVDASTYKLRRIIHAGVDPEQLDVSADGARMFVANEDTAQVSVVDLISGAIVGTAAVGSEPEGVTIQPDGKAVYVTSEGDGDVAVIDTSTFKVLKRIPVGHRPRSVGFLPDGSRAYVTLENDGALAIIDTARLETVGVVRLGDPAASPRPRPMGIAVRADGSTLYVTTGSFGSLFFIDPASNAVVGTLGVGQRPWGIAQSPDGKMLYTANGPSNDLSVIDAASRQVIKKIAVGQRPWGVAVVDVASSVPR